MRIDGDTRLDDLLKRYPFLPEFLARFSPKFGMITNPVLRRTIGKMVRLDKVASMGGVEPDALLEALAAEIAARTGDIVETGPAPSPVDTRKDRQEVLKGIIRDLHRGGDLAALKERFRALVRDVAPAEIAAMEQALIDEGMPENEVKRLCDVHVQVFKESLERHESPEAVPGHPLHTLMAENRVLEGLIAELRASIPEPDPGRVLPPSDEMTAALTALAGKLDGVERHYLKKENQLFPLLEAKGVSGPSKVMWAIHDDIRGHLKEFRRFLEAGDLDSAFRLGRWLAAEMADMIYKEEKILLPMSLETLDDADWARVKKGEEEIGYAWIRPGTEWKPSALPAEGPEPASRYARPGEALDLNTGALTPEQVDLLLTHLPVDVSFVDAGDVVRYYSGTRDRIFVRTPAVIGRKVQNCHPGKSLAVVNAILDAFRSGTRDAAEFWIELDGRFVHIRYLAVRDKAGTYRGCLEVTQDVTGIRALEGQKRLLDWK
jgi:DUF438 domain-containing protein